MDGNDQMVGQQDVVYILVQIETFWVRRNLTATTPCVETVGRRQFVRNKVAVASRFRTNSCAVVAGWVISLWGPTRHTADN